MAGASAVSFPESLCQATCSRAYSLPPHSTVVKLPSAEASTCFRGDLFGIRARTPFLLEAQCTQNASPFAERRGKNGNFPLFHVLAASPQATNPADTAASVVSTRTPPFNVVVTGSSKGIGYALAKKFLEEGDKVIVCSRSKENVDKAAASLTKEFGEQRAFGMPVDVRNGESVQKLVKFAKEKLGNIDIWINNAGSNAYTYKPLVETNDDVIMEIVETNTIGVMICCREAIKMMISQERGGHIFNMDGAGADGKPTPRFAAYGATKRSLMQLTKSLQAELKMQRVKNVVVHMLSPGMVTTDLLMSGSDTPQAKFFINILAEPADTVAEFLVPRIRSLSVNGSTKPTYIRFLTGFKAYSQILSRLLFKTRKNRYLSED